MPDATIKADAEDEEALAVHYGAKAWAAIKPAGDPEWNALPMEIRHKLIDLAKRYLTGHAEKQGDYAPAGFRDAVIGLVISDEVNIVAPEGAQGLNALLTDGRVLVVRERVDVASGDPIVDIDSRSPLEPCGLDHEKKNETTLPIESPAPEPVRLVSGGYGTIQPDPLPESSLKGTITVEKADDGVSATVNVDAPKPAKQKKK